MKNFIHIIIVVLLLTSLTTTASIEVKTDNFSFNNKANKTLVFYSNSFYDFECLTSNSGCESSGYINNIKNINVENLSFYAETMVSNVSISPSNVDYGAVEIGKTVSETVKIFNNTISNIEVNVVPSNSNVRVTPTSFVVQAGDFANVIVSMDVLSEGINNSQITFNTSNPSYPQIIASVSALGYYPAKVSINPTQFNISLQSGDIVERSFDIASLGRGTLNYYVSFESGAITPNSKSGASESSRKERARLTGIEMQKILTIDKNNAKGGFQGLYNIGVINNPGGMVWVGDLLYIINSSSNSLYYYNPSNGVTTFVSNIHSSPYGIAWDGNSFWIGSNNGWFYSYDLSGVSTGNSFRAPIWDYCSITYISGNNFYISSTYYSQVYKVTTSGTVISTNILPNNLVGSQLVYVESHEGGNLWVQPYFNDRLYQIKNDFSGVIRYVRSNVYGSRALAYRFSDFYAANSNTVYITNESLLNAQSSNPGILPPNTTQKFNFSVDATSLAAGNYNENIIINTNDADRPQIEVPVYLNVSAGQPKLSISQNSVDFGKKILGSNGNVYIDIYNNGGAPLELSDFAISSPVFNYSIWSTKLNPGDWNQIGLFFSPTDVNIYSGVLTFKTNDPNYPSYTISLSGEASKGAVKFNITDSNGDNINNAKITFDGVLYPAGTNSIGDLNQGSYSYTVQADGYGDFNGSILVDEVEEFVNISLGAAGGNIIMSDGVITTNCNNAFYDPGYLGDYSDNQDITLTILPSNPDAKVRVDFQSFSLESGWDYLSVYDGTSTSATLLGTFSGTSISPSFIATNPSGALTFHFTTDASVVRPGWVAQISCVDPNAIQPLKFNVTDKISHIPLSNALIVVSNVGIGNTDISGEYIFGNTQGGTYDYTVFRNGYYETSGTFTYPNQQTVNVEMGRWPNVTFTVLDNNGDPLPNASVSFGGINQVTDIAGQTTFVQVAPLNIHQWTASADGFQSISGEEFVGNDGANIEVKFINALPSILFTVTDNSGNPVVNANVELDGVTQNTDISGQTFFQFNEPFQNHNWSISASGYKTVTGEQFAGNSLVNVNVALQQDIINLTLLVVDDATGNPLSDAVVVFEGARYVTGSEGTIDINGIVNKGYTVNVARHTYFSYSGAMSINSGRSIIRLNKIPAVSLPYSESFNSAVPSNFSFYDVQVNDFETVWSFSNSMNSGGVNGEMMADYRDGISTVRMVLPPVNTLGYNVISFSFRHFFDDYRPGMKVLVETSTDGNVWIPTGWEVTSGNGNVGPAIVNLTLNSNTNSSNTYVAFTLVGDLYELDDWYVDDIQMTIPGNTLYNSVVNVRNGSNGAIIEGAQVSVAGYGTMLTNSSGFAYFTNLPNGTYNYTVNKDGFAQYSGTLTINNANSSTNVNLSPIVNYSLTVNVRKYGTTTPVQGALVSLPGIPPVETNAQGQAIWPSIRSGVYSGLVSKSGYTSVNFTANMNRNRVYTYSLRPDNYNVNFTVLDINSIPVQNAVVSIVGGISVATNESGQVTIPRVMNGSYLYKIEKLGYTTYTGTVNVSNSDVTFTRTLIVAPPVTYSAKFKVVDIYGALISNATINIAGYGSYLTNFLGEYTLTGLSNGANLSYGIIKTNYFDAIGVLGPINKNEEITIVLKPIVIQTYAVIFNVVDINGNPLAGASVDLGSYGTITTNGAGSATVTNVSYTDQLPYSITLAGYKTVNGNATIHVNTVVNVILPLSAATTYNVTFNVTNSTGIPVSNALVTLVGYGTLLTNNNGVAIFNQVNPQNGISYTVSKPPYANLTGGINVVNTNVAQNLTLNTNVYRAIFTVKDQFGNPAEGVNVEVLGGNKVVTDNYGNAIIGGLAPGTYSYNVFRTNESPLNAGFTITNEDLSIPVTLALTRNVGSVTFILRDEFNALVENASVEMIGYGTKVSDAIGQVTFTNVMSATNINYKVTKPGFEDYSDVITISNSSVDKNLVLKFKRYSVQFSVNSGTKSIADALITFNNVANSAGDYLFTNVLAGSGYAYSVVKAGYATLTGTVNVNSYTDISVNIEEEKFPVTFNVAPNASKSIDQSFDAKIMLGGRTDTLLVNTAGQTALNLTKGHYSFKAWANGYQAYYGTFEVVNGAVTVDVKLSISTGFDNNSLSSIKVYPNPFAKEIIVLNCKDVEGIVVTNIIGQPVTEFTNNGGDRLTINAESLTSGIYFVRLKATDGSTRVVRMIKQ